MKKEEDCHRDIYAGMVAEALNKAGYFGEVCDVYGFLASCQGKQEVYFFREENACAEQCLAFLQRGCLVTRYLFQSFRGYDVDIAVCYQTIEEKMQAALIQEAANGRLWGFNNCMEADGNIEKMDGATVRWSGFLYGTAGQYYVNAYLPATLKKWLELSADGVAVEDIKIQQYQEGSGLFQSKRAFLLEFGMEQ